MPGGTLAPSRLDELKKRFEENPRRFFAPLANEYRKSGDLDQAIALCQEHLADQAGNMNGHVVYGQALFDAGRYEESEATFGTALSLDPENLIALRHLGDIARAHNDAAKALEWYKRVLDADPRNDEILGFIEELKGASAAPPPAEPARAPTPVSNDAVTPRVTRAVGAADEGKTVEITPVKGLSLGTGTPVAPNDLIEPVRPSGPAKRMSLLDISLDLGGVGESGIGAGLDAPPADLSPPSFEMPAGAPGEPAASIELDSGLGWDMGSVDLVSASDTADESAPSVETPQVFVTETMAELYLQQGFRDEALQVYKQLAEQNPDDASLRDRISRLEHGDRASISFDAVQDHDLDLAPGTDSLVMMNEPAAAPDVSEPAAAPDVAEPASMAFDALPMIATFAETVAATAVEVEPVAFATPTPVVAIPSVQSARAFFASLAQRRAVRGDGTPVQSAAAVAAPEAALTLSSAGGTIDGLFGATSSDADDVMGRALATAVGTVESAPIRGKPTQAAASELTLDSVFRSDSPMRTSGPIARQSKVLNFDQFFAADAPADPPAPAADPDAPPASPADDAQFNSWLKGLRDQ